jgi:hypothetical protein
MMLRALVLQLLQVVRQNLVILVTVPKMKDGDDVMQ